MYIEKIRIRNVRCFEDVTLDLTSSRGPRKFAAIVGDNGVGKTTLLRCIAAGLCDANRASALLGDTYGSWRRKGLDEKGTSRIQVELRHGGQSLSITSDLNLSPSGWEVVSQTTKPRAAEFPWDSIFVCGYGGNRRATGSYRYEEYSAPDAVYSLFNYDYGLQDPELVLRRIAGMGERAEDIAQEVCEWIRKVLMLKKGAVKLPSRRGIKIRGEWGEDTLGSLGDGYEATLTWLLDLLSWASLAKKARSNKFRGIILLDELEQYLHPKWQRRIVSLLHNTFPNLQFITTTHSPLCAAGTADVPDEGAKVVLLDRAADASVELVDDLPPLAGLRSDQVLASRVFGYIVEGNVGTEGLLREVSILQGKGKARTASEDVRYTRLRRKLKHTIIRDRCTAIEEEIEAELDDRTRRRIQVLENKLFGDD